MVDIKTVKSINKNVRSSVRKLKPILKSIVGKKVDVAMRDLTFSEKRISKDIKKYSWEESWSCYQKFRIFRKKNYKRYKKNYKFCCC